MVFCHFLRQHEDDYWQDVVSDANRLIIGLTIHMDCGAPPYNLFIQRELASIPGG